MPPKQEVESSPIKGSQMSGEPEVDREVIVLTGAAGFIGFHTLSLLIERDLGVREIRCLDLREPSDSVRRKLDSKLELRNESTTNKQQQSVSPLKINWFQGDIRDLNLVERLLLGADCVIHAAAKIDLWTHWADQDHQELYSVNVEGTECLLKACQSLGVHKFIHVSSFETYVSYDTIYYATENTLPIDRTLLFGFSATSKLEAERKVRQYANSKLQNPKTPDRDQLLAVIIRFSTSYGEHDEHYVSKILEMAKFFNGKLQRFSNIWIRQQSIYAQNAAWALIKAKQRLDKDTSISGEEFHITDETEIQDPFDFVEPFLEARQMQVTKQAYPFVAAWLFLWLLFAFSSLASKLDLFGLFTSKRSRYQEAIEKDKDKHGSKQGPAGRGLPGHTRKRWYHYVMPQTLCFMCNSSFLNRTKASLRLDYEPIVEPEESKRRSLAWYRDELKL